MIQNDFILGSDERVLVTGAAGFIGQRVVRQLINYGLRKVRCLVRPTADLAKVESLLALQSDETQVEIARGNLLRREDCASAVRDVTIIMHLEAGRGEKSFPDAYLNSVVTTRNLLEAGANSRSLKRFV